MSGEILRSLAEPFEDATDDDQVFDQLVAVTAKSRAQAAAERAREAEVEAVICAEIAGLGVREAGRLLGVSPQRGARMRASYRAAVDLLPPEVPDAVIGQRLQEANWPDTEPSIRAAFEGMAWHTLHQG